MNKTLEELLWQKCRQRAARLPSYEEEEEISYDVEEESEIREELPLEDILAEKRRKYNAKEEFITLLYNDVLAYFVKEWDGQYIRKKPKKTIEDDSKDTSDEEEYYYEGGDYADIIESNESSYKGLEDVPKLIPNWPWRITLQDEYANIKFLNDNSYNGRISRKMMEGEGIYRWSNGARYKGEFQQNQMHGRGLLEWNSVCWYEGDFINGYRHGKGIIVDGDSHYMYTGQWCKGLRHGKGYCRYRDKGSYDGDWVMDKMNGTGLRIYLSGSRYVGQWKNGIRHGKGTMVWTNGNVYRGEWKCGSMDGYGEYIWNGFFNKTLTWPQEASYEGEWRNGMRHGKGAIKLNSAGGARYIGYWKENKKHGYGKIIGNNGETFESNPLFLNDVLCTTDIIKDATESEIKIAEENKLVRDVTETKPLFVDPPNELAEVSMTPILKPEQLPSLEYHITRLLNPQNQKLYVVSSISSGRCFQCEEKSCSCLGHHTPSDSEGKYLTETNSSRANTAGTTECEWKYEEHWMYNCLTLHMIRLRKIYYEYAGLFTKSTGDFNIVMSRLCLWQLWRDCNMHKKGFSLSEIDHLITQNETALINDPYNPFERIEIWQFLHALLELSWHLYIKVDNVDVNDMNGKLAGGLHKFLMCDVYPHIGNHTGNLCQENTDLLPMYCVFDVYKRIGYPPTAKDLLRKMCVLKGTPDLRSSSAILETAINFPHGINTVMVGGKVSYYLKREGILMSPHCAADIPKTHEDNSLNGLLVFNDLGAPKMLEIMALVCPRIKDTNTGIITNMDYKLTFLEFYEIILEATKYLLALRKKAEMISINDEYQTTDTF